MIGISSSASISDCRSAPRIGLLDDHDVARLGAGARRLDPFPSVTSLIGHADAGGPVARSQQVDPILVREVPQPAGRSQRLGDAGAGVEVE